jgi:ribosomal protein L22
MVYSPYNPILDVEGGAEMSINEIVSLEARDLSPAKAREVLDFIRFLKQRDERSFLDQSAETSLKKLWDTPEEDEAWKDL